MKKISNILHNYLRRVQQVRSSLNEKCLLTLVQALVIPRLDYCNSALYGLHASTTLTTILHCHHHLRLSQEEMRNDNNTHYRTLTE